MSETVTICGEDVCRVLTSAFSSSDFNKYSPLAIVLKLNKCTLYCKIVNKENNTIRFILQGNRQGMQKMMRSTKFCTCNDCMYM